ncbi:helix-turn-helix domain-containing protein [Sphingopyxis panaciterrae]
MREKTGRKAELATSRLRVGAAIRERRLAAGLSLAELADRIGVALSTMSKIENGKISTSFERLDSVGRALQADIAEFLGTAAPMAIAMQQSSAYGMRRSITRPEDGTMVDAGSYLEWFHASDMLQKRFQPIVAELLIEDVAEYGPFTRHSGEEFNYVLEGEMEFHTEIYAPVRLTAGSSIYFDAEMQHAHVRVGGGPCRILAILCPRMEPLGAPSPDRRSMRVVDAHGKTSLPAGSE